MQIITANLGWTFSSPYLLLLALTFLVVRHTLLNQTFFALYHIEISDHVTTINYLRMNTLRILWSYYPLTRFSILNLVEMKFTCSNSRL